jgi:hypothetical protein
MAYLDQGPGGTGEGLAGINRPGNANAGTAADHLAVLELIWAQLTAAEREHLVIRTDTAACTHAFLTALVEAGIDYTVGFYARADVAAAIEALPASAWVPAIDAEEQLRDGAWVAELTDHLHLDAWPAGMRVIARKERPHPGAQLRLTDVEGHRITCFATNHPGTDLPALELRQRRRALLLAVRGHQGRVDVHHDLIEAQSGCQLLHAGAGLRAGRAQRRQRLLPGRGQGVDQPADRGRRGDRPEQC